jgi:hypothetical protein
VPFCLLDDLSGVRIHLQPAAGVASPIEEEGNKENGYDNDDEQNGFMRVRLCDAPGLDEYPVSWIFQTEQEEQ